MTAEELLAALTREGVIPTVVGEELVIDDDPPGRLGDYLNVLHTGVRAVMTGRRWYGCDRTTGGSCGPFPARGYGRLAYGALDAAALLPMRVGLLTVEGDAGWDRIPPWTMIEMPELFALATGEG